MWSQHRLYPAVASKFVGHPPMTLPRRQFLHLAAGAAALPAMPRIARAQPYPSRPVRIMGARSSARLGARSCRVAIPSLPVSSRPINRRVPPHVSLSSRPPAGSGVWLPGPRELSCRAGSVRAFTVPLKKTYFCDPHHIFPIPLRLW